MKRALFLLTVLFLLALIAAPAGTAAYPPGLSFASVLNGVKMDHSSGELVLDNIQATFLPNEAPPSGQSWTYSPEYGDPLYALVKTSAGKEVARYTFYAEMLEKPYQLLSAYTLTSDDASIVRPGDRLKLEPGSYALDFYVGGKQFYHFAFSVTKSGNADPFAGGDYYYLDGDWEKWAYMFYADANSENSLQFKVWLRNKEDVPEKDYTPKIKITDPSGKLICTSRSGYTLTLMPEWSRYELDIVDPSEGAVYGQYWKAKDLLAKDGEYTLTMTLSDKPRGTWKIKVSGGKFAVSGRAARATADPLTFIEGGRDAFWFEKK